jgi:formylglycine-generating enzyme required for sulfatase activity/class 3 adenylate cyclase
MAEGTHQRKLTVIFAADVAGYSRLMAANERGTLAVLKDYRQKIDERIAAHRGRIVGSAGDSVLAEFASPVEAVKCAIEIQEDLKSRNSRLADHKRMEFRIGINLGDVIIDGPQIYGDGVNVAARLEGLAEAGGVCMSGSVYDQVRSKLDCHFRNEGRQRVKNIPERIRVYSIAFEGRDGMLETLWHRPLYRRTAVAGVVGIVAGAAALIAATFLAEETMPLGKRLANLGPAAKLKTIRDCQVCPELVEIPAGSFAMGSTEDEIGHKPSEGPRRTIRLAKPFALGRYEVTFAQWDACVADGGCIHTPNDRDWGRGNRPVFYVSWNDIQKYLAWLSDKTGHTYRLPSEAEWEYAARGGTATRYWWGEAMELGLANCAGCNADDGETTVPVGSYPPNPFGLYDVHGNVWEWTADCWNGSYAGAPAGSSAWTLGECDKRAVRGGAWGLAPDDLRIARRRGDDLNLRSGKRGFRVARDLP